MTTAELDRLLDTPARSADELRYDQEPARVKALRAQLAQAVAAARKAVIQAGADPVKVAEVERAVALEHRAGYWAELVPTTETVRSRMQRAGLLRRG